MSHKWRAGGAVGIRGSRQGGTLETEPVFGLIQTGCLCPPAAGPDLGWTEISFTRRRWYLPCRTPNAGDAADHH